MGIGRAQDDFLLAADAWLCDNYALDIRYIARPVGDAAQIVCALISMYPLEASVNNSFNVVTESLIAGQIQKYPVDKTELESILNDAIKGKISLVPSALVMAEDSGLEYYSETTHQNSWFSDLHLQISSRSYVASPFNPSAKTDNDLRASNPPFDGISDLAGWLGFESNALFDQTAKIVIRINPPIALVFDECKLQDDYLKLVLHAHSNFDLQQLGLAIRGVPADGIVGRIQAAQLINWNEVQENKREGIAHINIKSCDSALVMLMVGVATVRRQWFLDSTKARNNRYIAVQNFDIELRQIRRALFDLSDSDKFEKGIAALLFLLGFSPMLQLETDAPDLIVTTPGGQLLILECTLKISDFSEKLGKLVDRRAALSKSLTDSGHSSEILAVLVCRSTKEQIVIRDDELNMYKVLLLTRDNIEDLFNQIRNPHDPDKLINEQKKNLDTNANSFI